MKYVTYANYSKNTAQKRVTRVNKMTVLTVNLKKLIFKSQWGVAQAVQLEMENEFGACSGNGDGVVDGGT